MAMTGPGGGGGRRSRTRNAGGFNEINVTPFVDVMLVLLIIFMVAAPMMTTGVQVDLPKAKSAGVEGNDKPLAVSVKSDGTIFLQETEVTLEELGPKLQAISQENTEARIFVRGDTAIDYGRIMQVVGEINGAGFSKVALLTNMVDAPKQR